MVEWISTHSRAKAAGYCVIRNAAKLLYFNSQPREGGWFRKCRLSVLRHPISTHSRAKAAGSAEVHTKIRTKHFNSQPREGGWLSRAF